MTSGRKDLVDVRSPDEFTGKIIAPPNLPETAQRGGHIPGAKSVPWSTAVNTQPGTPPGASSSSWRGIEPATVG